MKNDYTVVIVSHVAIYREGVKTSLDARPGLRVGAAVGTLGDGLTTVHESKVDLCVTDIAGFESASVHYFFLDMARLDVPVVVIGLPRKPEAAIACLEAGASGYVTREASLDELYSVVCKTLDKGACVGEDDVSALVKQLQSNARAGHESSLHTAPCLTTREQQVARLLTQDRTNPEMAHQLGISVHTVKHHVRSTLLKLGMDRRREIHTHRDFVSRLLDTLHGNGTASSSESARRV